MEWYLDVLRKYADFSGRARRKEYWMFTLVNFIIMLVLAFIEGLVGIAGIISGLYSLAVLLPAIAVTVRRLHDTGRSGWWFLIAFIPIVGLVLLVFLIFDSETETNEFGINPKLAAS
jgi:uncharacterized membrane protein YhaH (DUF805 family)